MKVLVACEYSGIVRKAFTDKGHFAVSCDFLPTEIPGNHFQQDVLPLLEYKWDLLIAFPPCTYLSFVGNRWMHQPGRKEKQSAAKEFFYKLYNANIHKICIENPVGVINCEMKPSQIIHPYYFGDNAMKRTCLWLKNLPLLKHPNPKLLEKPKPLGYLHNGKPIHRTEMLNDWKERSRFWPSIAKAMANQWG